MGRARGAENNTNLAYEQPDPVKVHIINRDYGADAAAQRWFWLTPMAVSKLAQMGGEILRGRTGEKSTRPSRRTITPEQEDAIIAAATTAGKVHNVGGPFGVSDSLVRTLFRERGLEYPKTPHDVRAARAHATRRERNAALAAPPRPLIPYIGQEGSNVVSMPLSIRGTLPPSVDAKPATETTDVRKGTWGMERKVPPDHVIRADHAAGMTQSQMCAKYGVKGIDYHIKRLGLSKSRPVATQPAPAAAPAPIEATPAPTPVAPPSPSPVAQRPVPAPLPEVEDLDLMILAARIVSGAGCDAATAISIVRAWRS